MDAAEASAAVETELQRAGWSAADFSHADVGRYVELAAKLQEVAELSPGQRNKTALMPWYVARLLRFVRNVSNGVVVCSFVCVFLKFSISYFLM